MKENNMTLEQIKKALEDRNAIEVARRIGIAPLTIYKIRSGESKGSHAVLTLLDNYLTNQAREILNHG